MRSLKFVILIPVLSLALTGCCACPEDKPGPRNLGIVHDLPPPANWNSGLPTCVQPSATETK